VIFFWPNENDEPIHVHVCEGTPSPNATKIWITSAGGAIIAKNSSRIPEVDLNDLVRVISAQYTYIVKSWKDYFNIFNVQFYC